MLPSAALVGVVVVAVTMLTLRGGSDNSDQAQPRPTSTTGTGTGGGVASNSVGEQSSEQRWQTELENLDAARAVAFQGGDEGALTFVYAPDSSALAQDTSAMREMVGLGAHATGLRSVIDELEVVEEGPELTVLRITDRQQPYRFVSADGTVLSERPGKSAQTRDVTLVSTAAGWRIAQITIVS